MNNSASKQPYPQTEQIVKVAIIPDASYATECWQYNLTDCNSPGLAIEIITAICNFLSIQCELIAVDHNIYGDNTTGEWRGVIRQIMNREFDMSGPEFSQTIQRNEVVDFSSPIFIDKLAFVSSFPVAKLSPWSALCFNKQAGALIFAAIFSIGLCMALFDVGINGWARKIITYSKNNSFKKLAAGCLKNSLVASGLFLDQGMQSSKRSSLAAYLLLGTWSMLCIPLAAVYSAYIFLGAIYSERILPFSELGSLATCIQRKECTLIDLSFDFSFYADIQSATSGPYHDLKIALKYNPQQVISGNKSDVIDKIMLSQSHHYVLIGSSFAYAKLLQMVPQRCTLDAVYDTSADYLSIAFRKDSHLRDAFNYAIASLKEAGIIDQISKKYGRRYISAEKVLCKHTEVSSKPLSLTTFVGSVLLICAGSCIALMVLSVELIVSWCANNKKIRIS